MRKCKSWIAVITAAGLAASVLAGCGGTSEPQEDLVKPKEESSVQSPQAAAEGSIAQQVQAPSRFSLQFSDTAGLMSVSVDAAVTVPKAEGFRLKTVTSRNFVQEDYDVVNRVLLGGGKLWDRVMDENDPAHGFTKAEIEERIVRLKELEASGTTYTDESGKEGTYGEAVKKFEEMLKYAPETAEIKEIEPIVQYDPDAAANGTGANWLLGNVTCDGTDYFVSMNNNLIPEWRWIRFQVSHLENWGNYIPVGDGNEENISMNTPSEDITGKAQKAAADMGFDEFQACGGEYFANFTESTDGKMVTTDTGYGVHFTRMIDGIPVTYTHTEGLGTEGDWPSWPYENLHMVFNDEGLLDFQWTDPYIVTDLSDEYVFLMPFEEIQKIFKEMIHKKCALYTENNMKTSFNIDEIRLGYMRVMEKGNVMEGTMVPVWDFFGSMTVEQEEGPVVREGPFDSWMTINAMDGTVIDRELGY